MVIDPATPPGPPRAQSPASARLSPCACCCCESIPLPLVACPVDHRRHGILARLTPNPAYKLKERSTTVLPLLISVPTPTRSFRSTALLPFLPTAATSSHWRLRPPIDSFAPPQDVRSKLSPHEVDFLRSYAASLLTLRTEAFSSDAGGAVGLTEDIDLLAPISHPPKDLQVHVRVVRDCGVVHTELGAIDFKRGHRFLVRRSDIEHLIVQGYLEEL
ncbi:hypothetical protein NUW54_g12819 [Trametes sanguinea]|uniref:Uncharacterized protein n=1 Tax=Trametes sanguinea TaxID=158606 RepID=A0ACC1MUL9_9APHY|nr:hypothetical protein NUW54_g12819 [Trametes sanguinea]